MIKRIKNLSACFLVLLVLVCGFSYGCAKPGPDTVTIANSITTGVSGAVYEGLFQLNLKAPGYVKLLEQDLSFLAVRLDAVSEVGVTSETVIDTLTQGFDRINEHFKLVNNDDVKRIIRNVSLLKDLLQGYFKTYSLDETGKIYVEAISGGLKSGISNFDIDFPTP